MTSHDGSSTTEAGRDMPGLRTMRSPGFRLLLAITLALIGVVMNVVFLVTLQSLDAPWVEDFEPYLAASRNLLEGDSPYLPHMLTAPVPAACPGCYLYPPPLAQVLSPLSLVPVAAAKWMWFFLLSGLALLSVWLACGIGGARPTLERLAWSIAAVTFYFPVFHSDWIGNVGSIVAFSVTLVALGGAAAGAGAAVGSLLKVVPATLIPAVLVSSSSSRRTLILGLLVFGAASVALAPGAWADYLTVLRNMIAGSGDVGQNLAPAVMAERAGWSETVVSAIRVATVIAALGCLAGSVWSARRPGGMPFAALLAAVAMLVAPGTFWYHYLAVLLPLAAMAWPGSGTPVRWALFLAAVAITASGVALTYLVALTGALVMAMAAGWVLWPRSAADTARGAAM